MPPRRSLSGRGVVDTPPRPSGLAGSRPGDGADGDDGGGIRGHLEHLLRYTRELMPLCVVAGEELAESGQLEHIPELRGTLKEAALMKAQLEGLQDLLRSTQELIRGGEVSEEALGAAQEQMRGLLETRPDLPDRSIPELEAFKRAVYEAAEGREGADAAMDASDASDEEEDLVVQSTKQSLVCQLSQREFEDPVRNPACGHTFSRHAIEGLLRGAAAVKCPITGCPYNVARGSLERDVEMARRLERRHNPIF